MSYQTKASEKSIQLEIQMRKDEMGETKWNTSIIQQSCSNSIQDACVTQSIFHVLFGVWSAQTIIIIIIIENNLKEKKKTEL